MWDVTPRIACDIWLRHVDDIEGHGVEDYTTFDVRLAWCPKDDIEFSIVGRNLAEEWHREFNAYEVERSIHGKLTFSF